MTVRIAPSLLSADWARLPEAVALCESGGADWLHLDVMDGCFVPNLTFGARFIETVRGLTKLPLDVHLMVTPVDRIVPDFAAAGATYIQFHPEATEHIDRTIELIRCSVELANVASNKTQ